MKQKRSEHMVLLQLFFIVPDFILKFR